jgi:hypothetical protein
VATATATTILDMTDVKQQGMIFVVDSGGTRIGACGRFANYSAGVGLNTPILELVSNSGQNGSSLTLSGNNIQFTHTFGSTRTMRISLIRFNS